MITARILTASLLLVASGCSDTLRQSTDHEPTGINPALVTGRAAAALDANGQFQLSLHSSWKRPTLSLDEAKRLASIYVHRFARTNATYHNKMRGKPIAFDALAPCDRFFYAESPYAEPEMNVPHALVNVVAPRWFVPMCEDGAEPSMIVTLALTATHLAIDGDHIVPNSIRGNEFYALAIPLGKKMTPSPEAASERLAREGGQRITEVPVLVLPGLPWEPLAARWELVTENNIVARGVSGERTSLRRLFVGRDNFTTDIKIFRGIPTSTADAPETLLGPDQAVRYTIQRLEQMPRHFEAVSLEVNK